IVEEEAIFNQSAPVDFNPEAGSFFEAHPPLESNTVHPFNSQKEVPFSEILIDNDFEVISRHNENTPLDNIEHSCHDDYLAGLEVTHVTHENLEEPEIAKNDSFVVQSSLQSNAKLEVNHNSKGLPETVNSPFFVPPQELNKNITISPFDHVPPHPVPPTNPHLIKIKPVVSSSSLFGDSAQSGPFGQAPPMNVHINVSNLKGFPSSKGLFDDPPKSSDSSSLFDHAKTKEVPVNPPSTISTASISVVSPPTSVGNRIKASSGSPFAATNSSNSFFDSHSTTALNTHFPSAPINPSVLPPFSQPSSPAGPANTLFETVPAHNNNSFQTFPDPPHHPQDFPQFQNAIDSSSTFQVERKPKDPVYPCASNVIVEPRITQAASELFESSSPKIDFQNSEPQIAVADHHIPAHHLQSASQTQPAPVTLSRATSGTTKVIKGRAAFVTGASPFDSFGGSNNGKELFPTPANGTPALGPFESVKAPPSSQNSAASLFDTVPATVPHVSSRPKTAQDLFSQPPPLEGSKVKGGNSKPVSAVDVFSRAPPPAPVSNTPDFNFPPTAPGVKIIPKAIDPVPEIASPHSTERTLLTPKANPKIGNQKLKSHVMGGNALPTPHGFVSLPTTNNQNNPFEQTPKPSNSFLSPPVSANPLVHPNKLTSLFEVKQEEIVPEPQTPPTEIISPVPPVNSQPLSQDQHLRNKPATRERYIKPASAIVTFGFGGRTLIMLPNIHTCPPVYQPLSQRQGSASTRILTFGVRPSPLKIYRQIDLWRNYHYSTHENPATIEEIAHYQELLTLYRGDRDIIRPSEDKIKQFIGIQVQKPTRCRLTEEIYHKKGWKQNRTTIEEHERLLWSLLQIILEFRGKVRSILLFV
ncbi:hypothetical protein M1146_05220, partial [Patescibacteria group bacterium]|nr:hypothetical protein [Patescibacteria group bacterium]